MKKKTLITAISYKFLPAYGGGQLAHLYFHNAMQAHMENIVLSSRDNEFLKEEIKFTHLGVFKNSFLTYFPFMTTLSFIKYINFYKADYFMCSHPYLGASSVLACFFTKTPLISYSHNIESYRFKSLNKWWWHLMVLYEKWVMQSSKVVFFVTPEDLEFAVSQYRLERKRCFVSPFGINIEQRPIKTLEDKVKLKLLYGIPKEHKILYFIGSFGYGPNDRAAEDIIRHIGPRLETRDANHTILIIGGGLNKDLEDLVNNNSKNIKYLGFVKDLNPILLGADVMLNPMLLGGGIKTKVVEALGNNIKVVSTKNGANGINIEVCEDMISVVEDGDWEALANNVINVLDKNVNIADKFYDYYAWKNVTRNVRDTLLQLSKDY